MWKNNVCNLNMLFLPSKWQNAPCVQMSVVLFLVDNCRFFCLLQTELADRKGVGNM